MSAARMCFKCLCFDAVVFKSTVKFHRVDAEFQGKNKRLAVSKLKHSNYQSGICRGLEKRTA